MLLCITNPCHRFALLMRDKMWAQPWAWSQVKLCSPQVSPHGCTTRSIYGARKALQVPQDGQLSNIQPLYLVVKMDLDLCLFLDGGWKFGIKNAGCFHSRKGFGEGWRLGKNRPWHWCWAGAITLTHMTLSFCTLAFCLQTKNCRDS